MIALVRHPAVDAAGRCYGRTDLKLADPAAAAALAGRLAGLPGTVWTSPLQRCRSVAAALGPHRVDDRLMELDFGLWEGRLWDDVPRPSLDAWAANPRGFAAPRGETGDALIARVQDFWRALAPGDHVLISHGGPLTVLAALAAGHAVDLLAARLPFGSVTLFDPCAAAIGATLLSEIS